LLSGLIRWLLVDMLVACTGNQLMIPSRRPARVIRRVVLWVSVPVGKNARSFAGLSRKALRDRLALAFSSREVARLRRAGARSWCARAIDATTPSTTAW
jgi:hypothetical protein